MLSEQEEFELLSLRRQRAMHGQSTPSGTAPEKTWSEKFRENIYGNLRDIGKDLMYGGPVGLFAAPADRLLNRAATEGGGKIAEVLGGTSMSPETAAGMGVAGNVAIRAVPAIVSGGLARNLSPAMESGARTLMQSAVKPERAARLSGDAGKAIDTMLNRGINATAGGLESTQNQVTNLEKIVQGVLDKSPAYINKDAVAKHIQPALDDVMLNLEKAQNVKDINAVLGKFLNHDVFRNTDSIPAKLGNEMKQAFYRELKNKSYVPGADLTASALGQKALASGLRQEIAAAEPAIVPTLKEQSELINVLRVLGPRVSVEGNKNILGLGVLSPSMAKTLIWMLDRYPAFKSMMARGMFSGSKEIPQAIVGSGVAAGEGLSESIRGR